MLIDMDVLIWYMKGNSNALDEIEKNKNFSISVVTYMEFVQGMKNKKELIELRKALKSWNTKIIYISEEISSKAIFYVEPQYLSHLVKIQDALVGATAVAYGYPLFTGNDKHYKAIKEISLKKFRP